MTDMNDRLTGEERDELRRIADSWTDDRHRSVARLLNILEGAEAARRALPEGTVEIRGDGGMKTTLAPGERLDMFRADGSRIGTLVYGTPDEIEAAEGRLAAASQEART